MSWTEVADVVGMLLLAVGAFLCLTAAVGLVRFPDLLTRMHAGTKPQVLGVLLVLLGVGLRSRTGLDVGMLVLVGFFQMLTIPVGAHMVGRAGFRTGQVAPTDVHLGPAEEYRLERGATDEARDGADEGHGGADEGRDGSDEEHGGRDG